MSDVARSTKEGLGFGLIAGIVFAIAQIILTMLAGEPALLAFRWLASVVVGTDAFALPAGSAVAIALAGHLFLSAMFGLVYGVYCSALTLRTRRSLARQAVIGPLYGVMLWLVNFHVFARYGYPWLLALPQAPQVFLHAVFFGLPLGLLYASAERRVAPHSDLSGRLHTLVASNGGTGRRGAGATPPRARRAPRPDRR